MSLPRIIAGPHTHSMFNVPRTMVAVMVCLTPATLFGMAQFGWPAALLFLVTVLSALVFEALALALARRPLLRGLSDGSAVLTGWLLALSLPPWAPWWLGVTGAGLAILLAKHAFGGLGQNLFNPAMVARAMLLIALPVQMTTWVAPVAGTGPDLAQALAITFGSAETFDALSSASTLNHVQSGLDAGTPMDEILAALPDLTAHARGQIAGSLGETSAYLLLGGGIALVLLRIITLAIPLTVLGSVFVLSAIAHALDPEHFIPPLLHLTSGGLILCAFFIATDYVTSPVTGMGKALYGTGVGALIFVIRSWGAFPEGVAFAVLLMNAVTPLIDTYVRPRVFGRTRRGKPLPLAKQPGERA